MLTQPTEFQAVVGDLESCLLGYPIIHCSIHWLIHIKNAPALLTSEVVVGLSIPIEPA
jgi:hypothetical protein